MDLQLLRQAAETWNNTIAALNNQEKEGLNELDQHIHMIDLHHLDFKSDAIKIASIISQLSKNNLYNQEIIALIYNFYIDGGHHEKAYDYIKNAEKHLNGLTEKIEPKIEMLINDAFSTKLESSLQGSFSQILTLSPESLVRIVPTQLNDKRVLDEFILNEFVQTVKIIKEKIDGLSQITFEDKYNDLLLAILRLRLPIWGWEISDQARIGKSPTKKGAGESDLIIRAGGNIIALVEALVLGKRNRTSTQKHIKKTTTYADFVERYYMIIYYTGTAVGFDKTWESYKDDASLTSFTKDFEFDAARGYVDLTAKFPNTKSMRIAKSFHGDREFFHLFIDLSR
ncbi:hypothetical protein HNP37_004667 [Flavobacterium nitrogenifigens]|uniref:Uncharacterized protein n=2 Tax=Flavobacterium TaxID=237 RepID=A0A7W7J2U0_9FLAO|nr:MULTISPECIES: hypothetical protein [Flavobacterium]MBB4804570.1 hypothetical protein [Flavobacterium nitrogenifigens]MBB6389529.1 hypothetical protein [Flavobacterium notoginsengisoli]